MVLFRRDSFCVLEVMMANEKVNEDEAEAILSNLKMEGRPNPRG